MVKSSIGCKRIGATWQASPLDKQGQACLILFAAENSVKTEREKEAKGFFSLYDGGHVSGFHTEGVQVVFPSEDVSAGANRTDTGKRTIRPRKPLHGGRDPAPRYPFLPLCGTNCFFSIGLFPYMYLP